MSGKGIRTKNKQAPKLVPVFVYGTLKRGFPLHEWVEDQKFVSECQILDYTLISLGAYPALVKVEGITSSCGVAGELWRIDEGRFNQLRKMEERVGYQTVDVQAHVGEEVPVPAKAFVFATIKSGSVKWEQQAVKGREKMYPGRVVAA